MEFGKEILEKAKSVKGVEELLNWAEKNNISLKKEGTTFSFVHNAIMSVIVYATITEIHSQNTTLQLSNTAIVIDEAMAQI